MLVVEQIAGMLNKVMIKKEDVNSENGNADTNIPPEKKGKEKVGSWRFQMSLAFPDTKLSCPTMIHAHSYTCTHQGPSASSMLLKLGDEAAWKKDIHDLFAALIVQTPLTTHRYLFRNYYNTFSSEDAITALGSLRFSHTVRTPDPNDPSRLTRTTTTTTFNMAKDMAKALCSQFQACHLMQNAVDPNSSRSSSNSGSSGGSGTISDKTIWQLTPKGLCVLQDFCVRTEVDMSSMRQYFGDIYPIQLVRLDRHSDDDQLMLGRQNVSLIFMVMITSLPLEGNLLTQQQQQQQPQTNLPVPPLAKSSKKKKEEQGNSSSSSSGSSVSSGSSATSSSLPSNAAPFAMSTQVVNGDSRVQLLGNYLLTLSKTNQQLQQQQKQQQQKQQQQQQPQQQQHTQHSQQQNGYQQKLASLTKPGKKMRTAFSSQLGCDWLIDYSTVSCYDEGEQLLAEFVKYGWVECQDAKYADQYLRASTKIILVVTPKGKQVLDETSSSSISSSNGTHGNNGTGTSSSQKNHGTLQRVRSSSVSAQQQQKNDGDDETTLREMLAQDPESVMVTTTHQTTSSTSNSSTTDLTIPRSNSVHKANNSDNGFNSRSRPPSTAMDYPSPSSMPPHSTTNSNSSSINATHSSSLSIHNGSSGDPKESNATKLKQILDDAQLRSLFKDFLRNNFCEENLDFWIDYSTLRRKIRNQSPALPSQNQKDLLEDAYDLWATYLKPGAASELNVEHSLRQEMARVVNSMVTVVPTYIPGQQTSKNTLVISSHSVSASLRMILKWLDQVNDHICRLMSSDSVPKFVRTAKYKKIIEAREASERKEQEDLIKQLDDQHIDEGNHHHASSLLFDVEQHS
ncbi:hypothetical protein [Absidia glauca]|uniref:RGS domain-containing protein n=1 Tax=Absidia glauca TaxID=4829 RepID=A0A163JN43_ABSGL|nr:hypothetical protein [Absidia glauca]